MVTPRLRRLAYVVLAGCTAAATLTGNFSSLSPARAATVAVDLESVPDGTAIREDNSFAVFQLIGSAKVPLVNAGEFHALGYHLDQVTVVPPGTLGTVPTVPADGTLLRERSSLAVFIMDGGQRRWISSRELFDAAGYTLDEVNITANGALGSIPAGHDVTPESADSADFEDYTVQLRSDTPPTASTSLLAAGPPRYRIHFVFRKNRKNPSNSRLFLNATRIEDGRTLALGNWRAGSGLGTAGDGTNSCSSGRGWLPNGWYDGTGHYSDFPGDKIFGLVWQLDDKTCRAGVTRTELFIHSEMTPAGTQACSGLRGTDNSQCWEGPRDYVSAGCIKLKPAHIRQASALAAQFGGPKLRRFDPQSKTHTFHDLLRVTGG